MLNDELEAELTTLDSSNATPENYAAMLFLLVELCSLGDILKVGSSVCLISNINLISFLRKESENEDIMNEFSGQVKG